ncbi:MAG: YbjN domain-containing protein [Actinomycetota bacterium]|nr:YbjN domain-containing protein [Actinomycetota bacterium]
MNVAGLLEDFFGRAEIAFKRLDEARWGAQLRGERKLAIPILVSVTGDRISFESFFMRRPMENEAAFYELLLRRNARAYTVHFALDSDGDVFIVGQRAIEGLDDDELDRIIGSILIEADGMFDAAIGIGFASYLEADRRWRASNAETSSA